MTAEAIVVELLSLPLVEVAAVVGAEAIAAVARVAERIREVDLIVAAVAVAVAVAGTIGRDGFAALLPVLKLSKEQSKASSNFTRSSTVFFVIRRRITSLRNPTRSFPARLSRKLNCAKA